MLCFTVYAGIVPKFFTNNFGIIKSLIFSEICSGISLVCLAFSFVWIMMAKGSKAWYELYEAAICDIERNKNLQIPENYAMGEIFSAQPIDGNVFTNVAGAYSPSKLNIIIGRIFLIIWVVIFGIHYVYEIGKNIDLQKLGKCPCLHCVIVTLIGVSFLITAITAICNIWAKSSFLKKH